MLFSFKATFTITYGTTSTEAAQKNHKAPTPRNTHYKPLARLPGLKETQLSADILAMQRRIREIRLKEHHVRAPVASQKKPCDHALGAESGQKQTKMTKPGTRGATDTDRKTLGLEDVQSSDLKVIDLTGLSHSLLEHPKGVDVDYTEKEQKLMALLEKKGTRQKEAST